jgi:monoamine oxidase
VLVLEARERLGGRVWSRTINNKKSVVDFGASWLHGIKNNPLYPIVKSKKIATLRTDYDNETDYSNGKELSDKHVGRHLAVTAA